MLFKSLLSTATAAFSLLNTASADGLPAIEIVGNKFYYSNNGSQFYIKGIAYQSDTSNTTDSTFVDPLADASTCARDIPYMQAVDTNVIRVYALNTSLDHTDCMKQLEDAGIYVIADLSQPDLSINRDDPKWNLELLNRYTEVVDDFHNYTNVLGFFAGNEVTNNVTNTDASAFVKAAIRDTKAYIKEKGYRSIPVGYSANDDTAIRVNLADYFACGDEDVRADFFGINMLNGVENLLSRPLVIKNITQEYANLGIPLFFSEYGCNEVTPRLFQEVGTLYSDEMTDVWSGGIVYMYFEETNNYGLVTIENNKVSTLTDYNNYKSQILSISPSVGTANSASSASATVTTCPTVGSNWEASTNLPPTPDDEVCNCMVKSLSCVVSDDVDSDDYNDLFSNICGYINCDGIATNATTGKYGTYSMCNSKDQLNFLLNLYYLDQDSSKSACDWDGSATLAGSSTTASSCSAILKSAGTSGASAVSGSVATTGRSTTSASGSSGSSGSSSSGSSSSSSTSTKDSGAAMQVSIDSYFNYLAIAGSMVFGTGLFICLNLM